jgi:hypothetical protein
MSSDPIKANLFVDADRLKMLREYLCTLQGHLVRTAASKSSQKYRSDTIQQLIDEIDRHRPLAPNGKHGNLHTATCGCEDK